MDEVKVPEVLSKYSHIQKQISLETAIRGLLGSRDAAEADMEHSSGFYGHLLQCLSITFNMGIPTGGVYFDRTAKTFKMLLNDNFFCDLELDQRKGLLLHEIFHITFRHVYFQKGMMDKMILNVAMDMVINQYIKPSWLPKGCIDVTKFQDANGAPFPKESTTEIYYNLIMNGAEMEKPKGKEPKEGESEGDSDGAGGAPKGRIDEQGKTWINAKEWFGDKSNEFDDHEWGNGEGSDLEKMEALKDLIKRTMNKTSFSYGRAPKMIEDLLVKLDAGLQKLNYKQILLTTLKKSMPSRDTEKTWLRPSRRYGDIAKGNKTGRMPTIHFNIDTSGSISMEEANELLTITNNFMTIGVEKAILNLFADDVYLTKKIKRGTVIEDNEFKTGGTDLTGIFEEALKKKPDLMIVMTDGYYGRPDVNYKKLQSATKVVFIITKNGTPEHPLKDIGMTVKY